MMHMSSSSASSFNSFNPAQLEAYFSKQLGRQVTLKKLSRVPKGLSRESWVVILNEGKFILRCDLPGGVASCPVTLRFEYEVYRRLNDSVVPTARALWFEDDAAIFGQQFYIRDYIEGSSKVPHFDDPDPRYDDVRIAVAKEHARKMALVHTLDWQAAGFAEILPAPIDAASTPAATIGRLEAQFERIDIAPDPLLTEAFAWMRAHPPAPPARVMLCKGSNGDNQEVWRNGEIVAMSDWELASLGDPANDWARCGGYAGDFGPHWKRQDLLDYYESISGVHVTPAALDYYRLVYALEMILVGSHSALPVISAALPDARLTFLATTPIHHFHVLFARTMGLIAG